jgi:transcriptional regulator with XRE-family HTH domain
MVDRIREILGKYELSPTQFADAIGTARPIISHILSGRNKPSLEVVQKITAAFPDISLPWLLSGVGTMQAVSADSASARPTPKTPVPAVRPIEPSGKPSTPRSAIKEPSIISTAPIATEPAIAAPKASSEQVASVTETKAVPANPPIVQVAQAQPDAPSTPKHPLVAISAPADHTAASVGNSALQALAEPGKTIRRIVIFYSDGTFSDYQPE